MVGDDDLPVLGAVGCVQVEDSGAAGVGVGDDVGHRFVDRHGQSVTLVVGHADGGCPVGEGAAYELVGLSRQFVLYAVGQKGRWCPVLVMVGVPSSACSSPDYFCSSVTIAEERC